ncbi:hypothetical protein [Dyadobacter sp. LHD-138]|uniref:hypothetical protein n=1 Tax=Dyadobacter sp. LHD-138 TaxID=3071413 RepID=UPI0027E202B6|nr:hypothetical protein [Dyadobacter sp. LHD-138]MDQ6481123.1 hypothetical protein [Dyadobacter sp. LHD-138]
MDESFFIDVEYLGEELEFEGRLIVSGYLHKIEMDVEGIKVFFEPDEERNYRALVSLEEVREARLDAGLLQAIAARLESLLKVG